MSPAPPTSDFLHKIFTVVCASFVLVCAFIPIVCALMVSFFEYFNFLASYVFLNVIFYILITRLKIKISEKTDQQNTDKVVPLMFDYKSVNNLILLYNIKAFFSTFESLNENLLCCTYVRRRQNI
jgi:hypothetical protein